MNRVGQRRVGRGGRDTDLQELNGTRELQIALKVEGEDSGIGRIGEEGIENGEGCKCDPLVGVVGRVL